MPQNWEPRDWSEGLASRVAREVTQLRGSRSAQWLSDRTEELGCRVSRSVITDLENGRRKYVAVHELIMLAEALSVAPLELLYGEDNANGVEYVPNHDQVRRLRAVQRFSGIDDEVVDRYERVMELLMKATEEAHASAKQLQKALNSLERAGEGDGG